MGEGRLFHPGQSLIVQGAQTLHRLGRRKALVVVHHDRDVPADRLTHRANDGDVLADGRVADLRFDPGETAFRPVFRDPGRFGDAVIADRPIRANCFRPAQKAQE